MEDTYFTNQHCTSEKLIFKIYLQNACPPVFHIEAWMAQVCEK